MARVSSIRVVAVSVLAVAGALYTAPATTATSSTSSQLFLIEEPSVVGQDPAALTGYVQDTYFDIAEIENHFRGTSNLDADPVEMRSAMGLDVDGVALVADKTQTPQGMVFDETFGIALTVDEAAEMERRSRLIDETVDELEKLQAVDTAFAGAYIDHLGGGTIVVLTSDGPSTERVAEETGASRSVEIREVEYSLRELESAAERLVTDPTDWLSGGTTVHSVDVLTKDNGLRLEVSAESIDSVNEELELATRAGLLPPAYAVLGEVPQSAACTARWTCAGPTRSGTQIRDNFNENCAAGFWVQRTGTNEALSTAGHCGDESGLQSFQTGAVPSLGSEMSGTNLITVGRDIMLIDGIDSEDTAKIYGTNVQIIDTRDPIVDDFLCASKVSSGNGNVIVCSQLVATSTTFTQQCCGSQVFSGARMSSAQGYQIGDSGGPVFSDTGRAIGLINTTAEHIVRYDDALEILSDSTRLPVDIRIKQDGLGVRRTSSNQWFLRNPDNGVTIGPFSYGRRSDIPIVGDWNGDGIDTVGVYRGNQFLLRNSNTSGNASPGYSFSYGNISVHHDRPLVGDWDGDGDDDVGVYRPAAGLVYLRNSATASGGGNFAVFSVGANRPQVFAGDWDENGTDTMGYRSSTVSRLTNNTTSFATHHTITYGSSSALIIPANWDGDNGDTLAAHTANVFQIKYSLLGGSADINLAYGSAALGDIPVAGDWVGP